MLTLERVTCALGGFTLSVDLTLGPGARLVLVGPSGAGKSTLLNIVAGFQPPDAGRVLMDGRDVTAAPVAARPVSILFQDGNLFPHLTTFDNVALGLRGDLRLSEADRAAVEASIEQVGLRAFEDRKPGSLSGGQQARVALARMLLRDRPIALLDEPFAALDPGLRREMAALVGDLARARGMTLLMVVHDLRGLEAVASDVALLEAGALQLQVPFETFQDHPPDALRPWL